MVTSIRRVQGSQEVTAKGSAITSRFRLRTVSKQTSIRILSSASLVLLFFWWIVLWRQHATITSLFGSASSDHYPQLETNVWKQQYAAAMETKAPPVGYFNGLPVYHRQGVPPESSVHCVSPLVPPSVVSSTTSQSWKAFSTDTGQWMARSCHYQNLCMEMETHEYVLFTKSQQQEDIHVSLGGLNPRWKGHGSNKGLWKVRWSPTFVDIDTEKSKSNEYYELPDDTLWVPFHSLAAHNVGHLLWDDLYPIFTLIRIFYGSDHSLLPTTIKPFLMRHATLPPDSSGTNPTPLYATCDIRRNKRLQCKDNLERFLPIVMGMAASQLSANVRANLTTTTSTTANSKYVCAKQGVAGLGLLTDHGWKDHGWHDVAAEDGWVPHNLGRSMEWYAFGQSIVHRVMKNIQTMQSTKTVTTKDTIGTLSIRHDEQQQSDKIQIVFSLESSRDWDRRRNFTHQIEALQHAFPSISSTSSASVATVEINAYRFWKLDLAEQIRIASTADIYITTCGGGALLSTFLPEGATLIVYYNPTGGFAFDPNYELTNETARLDWDLLTQAAHLHVHWLPVTTIDQTDDLQLLVALIQHEINKKISR